jgi:hypothetical protein
MNNDIANIKAFFGLNQREISAILCISKNSLIKCLKSTDLTHKSLIARLNHRAKLIVQIIDTLKANGFQQITKWGCKCNRMLLIGLLWQKKPDIGIIIELMKEIEDKCKSVKKIIKVVRSY